MAVTTPASRRRLFVANTLIALISLPNITSSVLWFLVAVALILFPGAISNRVIRFEGEDRGTPKDGHAGFRIGIALLGLFFVLSSMHSIPNLAEAVFGPYSFGQHQLITMSGPSFQLLLGVLCLVRPGFIERFANLEPHHSHTHSSEGKSEEGN